MHANKQGGQYYTPELIERIAEETDFLSLVAEYTRLKKTGSKYVALCPFHREKTPSFHIDPDRGLYYCFGCGRGGNVYSFIMEKEGLTFPEAIAYLARRAGISLPKRNKVNSAIGIIEKINQFAHNFFKDNLFPL